MKKTINLRSDPIIAIVILIAITVAYFSTNSKAKEIQVNETVVEKPVEIKPQHLGNLVFENTFHDFGQVMEGDIVKHTFVLKNTGVGTLKILKTETSCGCTTATGAIREYAPGESGQMEVVVDTVGKKGMVVKTVTLTIENNAVPTKQISLAMNLIPQPHPTKKPLVNLNTDAKCKTCHLESAKGQMGIFLYHRVCSQCHGKKGTGGHSRALNDPIWQSKISDDYLREKIKKGWPQHSMPSFVEGVTPPLQEDQVESLVKYLREIGVKAEE